MPLVRVGCADRYQNTYLADVGLDLDEYLIEPMSPMNFDGLVARTPLCTVDKPRLLRDLTRASRLKRENLGPEKAEDYDIVVDATGIARAFLPPYRSDLTLPTLQHRVAVESGGSERRGAGVYGNMIPGLGYLWTFPVGNNHYHIGIWGIGTIRHDSLLEQFYQGSSDPHLISGNMSTGIRVPAMIDQERDLIRLQLQKKRE
jgi:hypothetical protein